MKINFLVIFTKSVKNIILSICSKLKIYHFESSKYTNLYWVFTGTYCLQVGTRSFPVYKNNRKQEIDKLND